MLTGAWLILLLSIVSIFLTRKTFLILRVPAVIALLAVPGVIHVVILGDPSDWQTLVMAVFLLICMLYGVFSIIVQIGVHGLMHKQGADAQFIVYAKTPKKIDPV